MREKVGFTDVKFVSDVQVWLINTKILCLHADILEQKHLQ